jgi:hypothetical protein
MKILNVKLGLTKVEVTMRRETLQDYGLSDADLITVADNRGYQPDGTVGHACHFGGHVAKCGDRVEVTVYTD